MESNIRFESRPAATSSSASMNRLPPRSYAAPATTAPVAQDRRRGKRKSRVLSTGKLPRMNNSERGKFYRQKYREYEARLEREVEHLGSEVYELQKLLELRHQLLCGYPQASENEVHAVTRVVYDGLRMQRSWTPSADANATVASDSTRDAPQASSGQQPAEQMRDSTHQASLSPSPSERFIRVHEESSTPMSFQLQALEVSGHSDSRVVLAHGWMYVRYRPVDLQQIFPAALRSDRLTTRLLAQEVAYSCTYRFHTAAPFNPTDLEFVSVEINPVAGLQSVVANPGCVNALLESTIRCGRDGRVEAARAEVAKRAVCRHWHSPPPLEPTKTSNHGSSHRDGHRFASVRPTVPTHPHPQPRPQHQHHRPQPMALEFILS